MLHAGPRTTYMNSNTAISHLKLSERMMYYTDSIFQNLKLYKEHKGLSGKIKSRTILISRLPKINKPILSHKVIITKSVSRDREGEYLILNKKNSFFFRKVGRRAILSHFSFRRPGPFNGPPLIKWNLESSELRLKSRNGKYSAGVTLGSRTPRGATGFAGSSNFDPRIFVALEISIISICCQDVQKIRVE